MKNTTLAGLLLILSTGAFADVIDFRLPTYSSINGQATASIDMGAYTMTLVATPPPATLTQHSDGIGIRGDAQDNDADEIESPEILTIYFTSPVKINSFTVRNLYGFELEGGFLNLSPNIEYGYYSTGGSVAWNTFAGVDVILLGDGSRTVTVNGPAVSSIRFSSPESRDEFSLAAIDVTATPEPAAIFFMGVVAAGTVMLLKRRRMA